MDFYNTLCPRDADAPPCSLDEWVANLPNVFPASLLKDTQWGFAAVEAVHLLGLGMLGGAVILLNMRLMGVGMNSEPTSVVQRNLRPWLWVGVVTILLTGIIIGMLNPEKLYTSPAFFVKMVAMVAALIFSFGVTNAVARAEGVVSPKVLIAAGVAFVIWLWSIGIFSTSPGANPGATHIIVAGYAILFGFARKQTKLIAGVLLATLVVVDVVWTYFIIGLWNDYDAFMNVTKTFVGIGAVALVGLLGYEIFLGTRDADAKPVIKLIALFSILSWVTVAAAGRWIGLS